MSEDDLPRVAQIGISGYGRAYLEWVEAAADRGTIRLAAVVVVNRDDEQAACERLTAKGVLIYDSWPSLFEEWRGRLDLCLAPVPIHLHEQLAVAAMEAGANVLIEKPLAATVEQARRIQAAERRTGRWVAVGYQDYYTEVSQNIAADLAAGRLGRVRSVRWLGLWPRSEAYYRRTSWAGRVAVSGLPVRDSPLNNAMAHYLNLAFYWVWASSGQVPEMTRSEAELFRGYPIESFDTGVLRIQTRAGISVHASASHCCPAERPILLRILGDEGELRWSHREQAVWLAGGEETGRLQIDGKTGALGAMFHAVLARLSSPGARVCTTEQALLQVQAIEALPAKISTVEPSFIQKSTKNGETRLIVENIAEDLLACMEREALPSEIGAGWANSAALAPA
jgi:predicted dehydrogenase